ncbi:TRM11 family SAM-dependent methyltransferase [Methanopyrus sp.]
MSVWAFVRKALCEPLRVGAPAPTRRETAEFMVRAAGVEEGDFVVDAGTGNGVVATAAAEVGCEVLAVDVDPEMIDMARRNAKEYGVEDSIEFVVADARELPELVDNVDAVLSTVPVKTVPEPLDFLRSCATILKTSGRFVQLTHWPGYFTKLLHHEVPLRVLEKHLKWVHIVPGFVFVCERV